MNKQYLLNEILYELEQVSERYKKLLSQKDSNSRAVMLSHLRHRKAMLKVLKAFVIALPDTFNLSDIDDIQAFDLIINVRQYNRKK